MTVRDCFEQLVSMIGKMRLARKGELSFRQWKKRITWLLLSRMKKRLAATPFVIGKLLTRDDVEEDKIFICSFSDKFLFLRLAGPKVSLMLVSLGFLKVPSIDDASLSVVIICFLLVTIGRVENHLCRMDI
jgi:hypothetical protein